MVSVVFKHGLVKFLKWRISSEGQVCPISQYGDELIYMTFMNPVIDPVHVTICPICGLCGLY